MIWYGSGPKVYLYLTVQAKIQPMTLKAGMACLLGPRVSSPCASASLIESLHIYIFHRKFTLSPQSQQFTPQSQQFTPQSQQFTPQSQQFVALQELYIVSEGSSGRSHFQMSWIETLPPSDCFSVA
jgi:hypothetical protein